MPEHAEEAGLDLVDGAQPMRHERDYIQISNVLNIY